MAWHAQVCTPSAVTLSTFYVCVCSPSHRSLLFANACYDGRNYLPQYMLYPCYMYFLTSGIIPILYCLSTTNKLKFHNVRFSWTHSGESLWSTEWKQQGVFCIWRPEVERHICQVIEVQNQHRLASHAFQYILPVGHLNALNIVVMVGEWMQKFDWALVN